MAIKLKKFVTNPYLIAGGYLSMFPRNVLLVFIFTIVTNYVLASSQLLAKDIKFAEDKVSFQAADGFTPLTQKEIDLKFPSKQAPRYVLGDKERVSTIAYAFKKVKLPSTNREEMQKELTKVFDRSVAGIKWIKNEITSINNFQWVYFEITSSAIDTDIHNIILMAPYAEGMVAFNFNATKKSFPKHEAPFRKAIASIKLSP